MSAHKELYNISYSIISVFWQIPCCSVGNYFNKNGLYCPLCHDLYYFKYKARKYELYVIYFIFLQIIWFTALFPYFVMTILLFRAITLEGASIGLMRYITPDWDKLYDSETWIDSATQVNFPNNIFYIN